ncbi:Dfp1/Him1, central region-domain-containing protein [Lophiotrema nucula]|uniref:Dfp1/Him1, central region-domain-containing protein n=1 Tax=Lophiotrema nucula TaxID=690887 RepID=A0A6A5ZBQ7_9PLEO|nr:Dfp1/Him1, central region-domain-containing protein [Lophiotrema nucula]
MNSRRVPLANLQNATNSPLRAQTAGAKRSRSHASEQRDMPYGQPPPKKQMIAVDDAESTRFGLSRKSGAPPNAFQRKLEAVREVKAVPKQADKTQRTVNENLETIRQWQRHYRKMFPTFVFYFESISEDVRSKVSRQAQTLGAREVKFFSREATHVITTRPIPADSDSTGSTSSSHARGTANHNQLETKKSIFDAALQKNNNGDILSKAKELGMKIWSADKLQRMLITMFNDTGEGPDYGAPRHASAAPQSKLARQADLQTLLQNEKRNGPLDRDHSVDMVQLRGFYIYIHDMDEATKPVMVREYPKVAKKEEGKWPQFRMSGHGKCPFVEDPNHIRRLQQEQEDRPRGMKATAAPRTRAAAAMEEKRALGENNNLARRATAPAVKQEEGEAKPLDPPKVIPAKRSNTDSMPPMFGSAQASIRAMPRFAGGEPIASGIQPSNITSAIRSQMISSTAAAPGARAGHSKEVNQLKRRVLDKNNSAHSANSGQSSVMNDMRAALNQEAVQPARAAKRKAQETLGLIHEDGNQSEEERQARKAAAIRRRKPSEKELKPGYCENCREKFNDFDEHTVSRKHRKFAMSAENWQELDDLLAQLVRR